MDNDNYEDDYKRKLKIRQKYKQMSLKQIKNQKVNQRYRQMNNKKLQDNKIRKNYNKLIQEKLIYRIINSLSTRIHTKLTKLDIKRTFNYTDLLGCSIKEFENYLLENLKEGMTCENYGKWEVDHIIPFSHFNFYIYSDIIKCCEYHNLQPLWKPENREKSDKIITIDNP